MRDGGPGLHDGRHGCCVFFENSTVLCKKQSGLVDLDGVQMVGGVHVIAQDKANSRQ